MYMNQLIVSKVLGAQWKVSLVALSQAKPGKTSMARAVGGRQELGQNLWSNTGFCLCHIKTSRGEGLSPAVDPAGRWSDLSEHSQTVNGDKMSVGIKQGNRNQETWSTADGSVQHSHRSVGDLGQATSLFCASLSSYLLSASLLQVESCLLPTCLHSTENQGALVSLVTFKPFCYMFHHQIIIQKGSKFFY